MWRSSVQRCFLKSVFWNCDERLWPRERGLLSLHHPLYRFHCFPLQKPTQREREREEARERERARNREKLEIERIRVEAEIAARDREREERKERGGVD